MANENRLGLDDEDQYNIKGIIDDLIDVVATFSNLEERTEEDYSHLMSALDFGKMIVSGVVYKNGIDLCAGHEHDEDDDDDE